MIHDWTAKAFLTNLNDRRYLDHLRDTWQTFYDCDPRNFNGTLDLLIGGHASMWGEHVDAR